MLMRIALLVAALAHTSCASQAELSLIYSKAASYRAPDRNPIVVIPGIMGSSLRDVPSGSLVWGAFDGKSAKPTDPEGARLLALPLPDGDDDVEPTGVLDHIRVRLVGIPLQMEVYARILGTLGVAGYRDADLGTAGAVDYGDDHFTCFQFAYDWRKDNAENAARLHAFLTEKRTYVREEYRKRYGIENAEVKFDIVAHSMGSLVTRYFLRYGDQPLPEDGTLPEPTWAGAELAERVVLIAPPNAGSLDALVSLVEGRRLAPTLPLYPAAILGTFPST
jgi:pimeloyl-ACP methyl ester carboxylesterase